MKQCTFFSRGISTNKLIVREFKSDPSTDMIILNIFGPECGSGLISLDFEQVDKLVETLQELCKSNKKWECS